MLVGLDLSSSVTSTVVVLTKHRRTIDRLEALVHAPRTVGRLRRARDARHGSARTVSRFPEAQIHQP